MWDVVKVARLASVIGGSPQTEFRDAELDVRLDVEWVI
jgi:hypothetical protein